MRPENLSHHLVKLLRTLSFKTLFNPCNNSMSFVCSGEAGNPREGKARSQGLNKGPRSQKREELEFESRSFTQRPASWGTWMAQCVEQQILDLGSGHDRGVLGLSPTLGALLVRKPAPSSPSAYCSPCLCSLCPINNKILNNNNKTIQM